MHVYARARLRKLLHVFYNMESSVRVLLVFLCLFPSLASTTVWGGGRCVCVCVCEGEREGGVLTLPYFLGGEKTQLTDDEHVKIDYTYRQPTWPGKRR